MKLKDGFFQTRGFTVAPEAVLKTSAEIVFPETELLRNPARLNKLVKEVRAAYIRSFFLVDKEFDLLGLPIDVMPYDKNYSRQRVLEVLAQDDIFTSYLDFLEFNVPVRINIIPVCFGTSFTYTYVLNDNSVDFYSTYRYDLPYNYFISGLIGSSVLYKTEENKQQLDETQRGNVPWINRQFLVDFLSARTKLSHLVGSSPDSGTLKSLRDCQQYAQIFQESRQYLEKLKLAYPVALRFEKNKLIIDDINIDLTLAEAKIVAHLHQNRNKLVTFDDLADAIWADNDDKFSMYALSKHIANIRKKVSEAGFTHTMIQVARKQGVILSI